MAQSQPKTGCFVFIYGWYKQVKSVIVSKLGLEGTAIFSEGIKTLSLALKKCWSSRLD